MPQTNRRPRSRSRELQRIIERDRRAVEARLPPAPVPVTILPPGRGEETAFENERFHQRMHNQRRRFQPSPE